MDYGVRLGPGQLVVISLMWILTSFSLPGVPHKWLLIITPVVATHGIPAKGTGLLIAADVVRDIFATTLNVTGELAGATVVLAIG